MKMNGCHNHAPYKPYYLAQDGWVMHNGARIPKWVKVPQVMSVECQYSRDPMGHGQKDIRCEGCSWRATSATE